MALTSLQKSVLSSIADNRSDSSYIAGGTVLNMDWPRLSDDIDIFHDTDEEIGHSAHRDIARLKADGFKVDILVNIYGCIEAEISKDGASTLVQWMSESKVRFFALVRDEEWGARLHPADLAVNKVLAAASRRKARDYVDLVMISENYCSLAAIIVASAGKPPHWSPVKTIDEIRHKGLSISNEEFQTVKGIPENFTPVLLRDKLVQILDRAEHYARIAPIETLGLLAVNADEVPQEVNSANRTALQYRKATNTNDAIPQFSDIFSL